MTDGLAAISPSLSSRLTTGWSVMVVSSADTLEEMKARMPISTVSSSGGSSGTLIEAFSGLSEVLVVEEMKARMPISTTRRCPRLATSNLCRIAEKIHRSTRSFLALHPESALRAPHLPIGFVAPFRDVLE
jgi:hypothetical protein